MKNADKLEEGFTCTKCGTFNRYPSYVYAHWYEELIHTCDCKQKHRIKNGRAFPANA